ncbi:MAG TPA: 16S rRNA (adenine(1518)-N(6)/adenine(1519)-N(6))-dimethyltransferase RsmA [Thermoplasmata archaeon]|nr:16S rRNA (adenine(1518)-N(6)/adenine(1519)-N(6))-dimethyltransferase RsmA [Thermoplasmata archaeon]
MPTTSTGSLSPRKGPTTGPAPIFVPERSSEIHATLERLRVRPSRALGQSFLSDPFVADAEAALVELPPGRPVLEIGGGLGVLTAALLRRGAAPLTVIERDRRLAGFLRSTFGNRIRVLEGDALTIALPRADCVVGNLPYSVGTPILLRLLAARYPRVVFLLQKEVVDRIAAGPGSKQYGRLSIAAQLYGTVERFRSVPPSAFTPEPEVASRLAVHVARDGGLPVPSVPEFERVVRLLFGQRRKQLSNLLPTVASSREDAAALAREASWPEDWAGRRPEELPPEAYFALARAIAAREGGPRARGRSPAR